MKKPIKNISTVDGIKFSDCRESWPAAMYICSIPFVNKLYFKNCYKQTLEFTKKYTLSQVRTILRINKIKT